MTVWRLFNPLIFFDLGEIGLGRGDGSLAWDVLSSCFGIGAAVGGGGGGGKSSSTESSAGKVVSLKVDGGGTACSSGISEGCERFV